MKVKTVRASLAAVLTATLLISLFPLAYAGSAASWNQQEAAPKPRRGKNGGTVSRSADSRDTSTTPNSGTEPSPDAAKPTSPNQPNQQQPALDKQQTTQATDPPPAQATDPAPAKVDASRNPSPWNTGASTDSASSQRQREVPSFDRPPLRGGSRPAGDPSVRGSEPSSPARSRPSYSGGDSTSRGDSRGQTSPSQGSTPNRTSREGSHDRAAGSNTDPERDRSNGSAPVLRRPADSRSRDEVSSPRPPVLRRPSDPQPDEAGASDRTAPPSGSGQQQAEGPDDVVKLESTLVNLPLLVSDRSGRYIPQLSARDFSLHEDGVQQTIASFGSEEVPFSVVLLLDVSPSVQGNADAIQDAAIAFVRQLRNQDRVMVASFDRQIHYHSDFTSDRRELEWAIRKVNIGSGTSVYDAVFEVIQRKLKNVEGRKALILFSDGEDTTSSRASYDDAVNVVTESDVLVYGLRYPGSGGRGGGRVDPWPRSPIPGIQLPFPIPWPFPRRRRGPFRLTDPTVSGNSAVPSTSPQSWPRRNRGGGDFMADITTAGGGPVYDAEKIGDLSRVANRIAEELRHVYVIGYYPTNALSNGGYRSVRVSFKGRDDIAVRHRRGYNARQSGTARPTT